jgi:hypothetical protein
MAQGDSGMKMHLYLSIVGGVMLLGFILTYIRDQNKINATAFYGTVMPQQFQDLGVQFAEKTRTGPITEWMVYSGSGDGVMADGMDSEGRQVIKCVFDKRTGRPFSILRPLWKDVPLDDVPKRNPRDTAAWWLKHVIPPDDGGWRWVRNGKSSLHRYLSVWECADYMAFITIQTTTGRMLSLRLHQQDEMQFMEENHW